MFRTELMQDIRDFDERMIVDVREPDEYKAGHIPKAINLPMSRFVETYTILSKQDEYLLVCASGNRSGQVAQFLNKQGYQVVNALGGMGQYKGVIVNEV